MPSATAEIFRQAAINHHFELQSARLHREGKIRCPLYLSLGTEHIPPAVLAGIGGKPWPLFGQHRVASWYLTWGGDPLAMFRELLGRSDGCNGGLGGSASISIRDKAFGHSGLLGDQAPIAVGFAAASDRPTVCVLGDAACEEDYVILALGHAATVKAPVLFIVEDNGLSIKSTVRQRRSWNIENVCVGFGLGYWSVANDTAAGIEQAVEYCKSQLPALLNVRCKRCVDHAGSGGVVASERYEEMRARLGNEGQDICIDAAEEMQRLAQQAEGSDGELQAMERVLQS